MRPSPPARRRDPRFGGADDATIERRPDGTTVLRSTEALEPAPDRLTDRLEHWAAVAPERTFIARRGADGAWVRIGYAAMRDRARRLGQALLDIGRPAPLSAERPLLILSGNDLEHASLAMAAMLVGAPYAPVSTAYSLVSSDFGKLRHIVRTLTPGAVYAGSGAFAAAVAAVVPPGIPLIVDAPDDPAWRGRAAHRFADLLATEPGSAVDAAQAATGPDTIVKFLFTSGSTKQPKAVINTQRMLSSNQQMLRQCLAFVAAEPPVLVDWLPWNHTFGGNHNLGLVLMNGGTLYIDDGRPTPAGMAETLRNLREISPTVYFNVPKGFEEIAAALEDGDAALRESLFRRLQAFMYAGAGLAAAAWLRLNAAAERTRGAPVPMMTGLGMTETAPLCVFTTCTAPEVGRIGLPVPGVEVKLVPLGDAKTEIRFRGPNVTPGYWRAPDETAAAFDAEGYYRTGDAVRFVDPDDPARGLAFDGRLAEDFKLSTGTFVSAGPLRARAIAAGAPRVADVVVTGLNRDDVGLLVVPRPDACRALAGAPPDADLADVLDAPPSRAFFQALVDRLDAEGTGSANRVARLHVLLEPPSLDAGEITDKGSINQRAVLGRRAAIVDALHDGHDPRMFRPSRLAAARP